MDAFFFHLVNNLAGQSASVDAVVKYLSTNDQNIMEVVGVLCVVLAGRMALQPKIRMAIVAGISALITGYLALMTNFFLWFHRARPYTVLTGNDIHLLTKASAAQAYTSFPSGHAMFFFAIATSIFLTDKCKHRELGWLAFIVATVLSLSKLYVGAHWPSDLIVGGALGALIAWIVWRIVKLVCARVGKPEAMMASGSSSMKMESPEKMM